MKRLDAVKRVIAYSVAPAVKSLLRFQLRSNSTHRKHTISVMNAEPSLEQAL
jgi:hypothetical protein